MKDILLDKIKNRHAKVVIFGLGRIGLPIATLIARAGFQVIGVDLNPKILEDVSNGRISVNEPGLSDLIKQTTEKGLLKVTLDGKIAVKEADISIMCVPTSLKEDNTPDLSHIEDVSKTIVNGLIKGKLIIVESTLPPTTTNTFIAPLLEEGSGLKCGIDFWLSYCPERLTPGKALKEFVENDRIIGGYDQESSKITAEFFKSFTNGNIHLTDVTSAELVKLVENTFRDVNIAFANQLALICEQTEIDVLDVIKLANTHPRVSIHTPGPGVGGPCLPKDPYLLTYKKTLNQNIIKIARQINDYMPRHVVKLFIQALEKMGKDFKSSRISILGTAYKGNVDDSRKSPSKPIIHELIRLGVKVTVYDPHCNESFGAKRAKSLNEAIKGADCLVIITDHTEFKNINLNEVKTLMNDKPVILDGRRVINPHEAENLGIFYYGIGFGKKKTYNDQLS